MPTPLLTQQPAISFVCAVPSDGRGSSERMTHTRTYDPLQIWPSFMRTPPSARLTDWHLGKFRAAFWRSTGLVRTAIQKLCSSEQFGQKVVKN